MSKYVFKKLKNEKNQFDNNKVLMISETDSLHDLIENFEDFLKGCGFSFKGNLEIVEPDEE